MRTTAAALAALLTLAACGGPNGSADSPPPSPSPDPGPPAASAPWSAAPLAPTRVPDVYLQQWARADNRRSCALVAPAETTRPEAEPRAATFGGGWGVAYDLPGQRSAFGVAGTGAAASEATYDDWPHRIRWSDGSSVGYGPEGGSGPNQLAYLRIEGEGCLYNVWSRLGRDHLERLLTELRFVDVPTGG